MSASLIHSFPSEILSAIFKQLGDTRSVSRATLVCPRWYTAATADSDLWLSLRIDDNDILDRSRPDLVRRVLARSKGRPLALSLSFPGPQEFWPEVTKMLYYETLARVLLFVVKPHLRQCQTLQVIAHQDAWLLILAASVSEDFPFLTRLDLKNTAAKHLWELGEGDFAAPTDLVFPLPTGHQLELAELEGVSLGNASFPKLRRLGIHHYLPDMLTHEERLNPWMLTQASELVIEGMCIPYLDFDPSAPLPPSKVQRLVLSEICAMPADFDDEDDGGHSVLEEEDCVPFFETLFADTSVLTSLCIDRWDLNSRIFEDFIVAFSEPPLGKFAHVTHLTLRGMPLVEAGYTSSSLEELLSAFPALQRLYLHSGLNAGGCVYPAGPETWEELMDILEMNPTLCPDLQGICVDEDGVLIRDDPLPFRNCMFLSCETRAVLAVLYSVHHLRHFAHSFV